MYTLPGRSEDEGLDLPMPPIPLTPTNDNNRIKHSIYFLCDKWFFIFSFSYQILPLYSSQSSQKTRYLFSNVPCVPSSNSTIHLRKGGYCVCAGLITVPFKPLLLPNIVVVTSSPERMLLKYSVENFCIAFPLSI